VVFGLVRCPALLILFFDFENVGFFWLNGFVIRNWARIKIHESSSTVPESKSHSVTVFRYYFWHFDPQLQKIDRLVGSVGNFKLQVTGPLIIVHVLQSFFLVLFYFDLDWHMFWYQIVDHSFLRELCATRT
jgi:hypothetical protein